MSCKLWSKVTSVFLNINFCAKTLILGKKWNFVRNVDFLKQLCTTTESEYLIGKHSYFQKIMTFVWLSIYIKKLSNSDKNFYFFRKCLFVHVFIFIKVFYLLENCYFDSKYHFIRWYFGQKCHFPSRIYISGGIHSLDKLSNFLRKGHNLGKTKIGFRSNLVVSFEKNDNWFSVNCFVMCVSLVKAKIVQKHQYWRIFSFF